LYWYLLAPAALRKSQQQEEKKENPLIVIDGIKYLRSDSTNALQKLDPVKIKEIKVLRGQEAIDLYGEEGKSGVILVTTKTNTANKPLFFIGWETD
jgi:hypothetical protein